MKIINFFFNNDCGRRMQLLIPQIAWVYAFFNVILEMKIHSALKFVLKW